MIRAGTYGEFADKMIGEIREGARLHGGNFSNLLCYDGANAARVYNLVSEYFGPFVTAAEFAQQCDWNTPQDARQFVQEHPSWPPRTIADELRYL